MNRSYEINKRGELCELNIWKSSDSIGGQPREGKLVTNYLCNVVLSEENNTWKNNSLRAQEFESALQMVKEYAPTKFQEILNVTDIIGVWTDEAKRLYPERNNTARYPGRLEQMQCVCFGRRRDVSDYQVYKKQNKEAEDAVVLFVGLMQNLVNNCYHPVK